MTTAWHSCKTEQLGEAHTAGLLALLNDPVVARWLGGGREREQVEKLIEADQLQRKESGFGAVVAVDGTRRILGRAGVRPVSVAGSDEHELFYTVHPDFWGRGIAVDLSKHALAEYFAARPRGDVIAFTLPTNRASVRVMQKLGFSYERNVDHAELDHVLYRLKASSGMVVAVS